jgi:hypothetical protein
MAGRITGELEEAPPHPAWNINISIAVDPAWWTADGVVVGAGGGRGVNSGWHGYVP